MLEIWRLKKNRPSAKEYYSLVKVTDTIIAYKYPTCQDRWMGSILLQTKYRLWDLQFFLTYITILAKDLQDML